MPGLPPGAFPAYDPDGHDVINRSCIITATAPGGISVAAAATNFAITTVPSGASTVQFLQSLRLVCTVAPSGAGLLSLLDSTGGTVLIKIPVASTYLEGQILDYNFPVPLHSVAHSAFFATTAANTGTWFWLPQGFVMDSAVVA